MGKSVFDIKEPTIILDVIIKGRIIETTKMALDTGSTYVIVPWKIINALGLEPEIKKERSDMITVSGTEKVPIVTLPSVIALGEEVKNVKAIVHDLPQKSYVDGLLGLSFLKNFNINLNFKEGVLEIS